MSENKHIKSHKNSQHRYVYFCSNNSWLAEEDNF